MPHQAATLNNQETLSSDRHAYEYADQLYESLLSKLEPDIFEAAKTRGEQMDLTEEYHTLVANLQP